VAARWLSRLLPGTPAQTRAYREAHITLWCSPDRSETPRYHALNDRAYDSGAPLSGLQQAWHFQVALSEYSRDETRRHRRQRRVSRGRR
jgi:hypothetical protein